MCLSISGPGNPDLWPFKLETGTRVSSKVGNLHSEFGQARPSGSRVIRYVRDGQTDGQKQRLLPVYYGRGHNNCANILTAVSDHVTYSIFHQTEDEVSLLNVPELVVMIYSTECWPVVTSWHGFATYDVVVNYLSCNPRGARINR